MVEVDDLSVIPKKIACSCKGVRDNKYRFYSVNVVPTPTCLPVSLWTEERYNSYVDEGGSRDELEEGWSEGWSRRGEAARRRAEDGGEREADDGAVDKPGFAGQDLGVHAPTNLAEMNARSQEPLRALPRETQGGTQENDCRALAKEEEERRRKGKGIMVGVSAGARDINEPRPISSGSGSWDPNDVGGHQEREPLCSQDVDSKAEGGEEKGQDKEMPIVISDGSKEDEDLGGGGGKER